MMNYIKKLLYILKYGGKKKKKPRCDIEAAAELHPDTGGGKGGMAAAESKPSPKPEAARDPSLSISDKLDSNFDKLKGIFGGSGDVVFREFYFGKEKTLRGGLIFIDGLVDKNIINQSIIKPMMYDSSYLCSESECEKTPESIESSLLSVGEVQRESETAKLVSHISSGDTVFLVDGFDKAFVVSTRKWENRGIQEPQTEIVVRGPREGFTETLRINTSLLRRKIKSPDLTFESMVIGQRTKTDVCIAYLKGVTPQHIVDELRRRLKSIDTDSILESGYIEQLIEDSPFSLFPVVGNTEKPDVAAAKILEGRAAVIVDGTPFVLTVPYLFIESFQTSEDYYMRYWFASFLRFIRFFAFFITVFAPSIYLAVLTYHAEMIPTPLLFTLAASEEGLPFPIFIEMFLMLIVFEILREAGVRLPRPVGQAVSIVGALVIGQAAVAAGIVSDFTVIVIAITAISSFCVTSQADSGALLRFICYFFGAALGGFGIVVTILGILISLTKQRSLGMPYLSPIAPLVTEDLKDVLIRFPHWKMTNRPKSLEPEDIRRQGDDQMPGAYRNEQ